MTHGLGCLMEPIIRPCPVEDPHLQEIQEDQIIDTTPIYVLKPLRPSDHVRPESIVKEQVQVHIPPPLIVHNGLVIWLPCLHDPMKGIPGNLQFSISTPIRKETKREITL